VGVGSDGCVLLVTASENGFIEDPLISQVNMQGKKMKSRVLGMSKKRMNNDKDERNADNQETNNKSS
jgi:hypothetical protein